MGDARRREMALTLTIGAWVSAVYWFYEHHPELVVDALDAGITGAGMVLIAIGLSAAFVTELIEAIERWLEPDTDLALGPDDLGGGDGG